MLNLDTVDVPIEGDSHQISLQDQAEFLKEITKPVLAKAVGSPATKVLFEDAEEGNGLSEPLDVIGGGRARRGLSAAGFSAKERAAFIESMIASGNPRDRSKSDTGTYYGAKKDEEEAEDGGRSRTTSNASQSYFNETNVKEVSVIEPEASSPSKNLPPYLRFAAGREKRSVSDAAYTPTVVTNQPPARTPPTAGREKRSVSDAAYMKWARKQLPNEEDEEFDDFEEEAPADTGILEEPKQVRGTKALAITDPNTNKPIEFQKQDKGHHSQDESQGMTWDEFHQREDQQYRQPPHPRHHQHQHQHHQGQQQYTPAPMGYPSYGVPPAYSVPYGGQPMYSQPVYPASQPLMYVHRTPERYRWEQSLQKFVKTMDANITYYPMAPSGVPPQMGMGMPPPSMQMASAPRPQGAPNRPMGNPRGPNAFHQHQPHHPPHHAAMQAPPHPSAHHPGPNHHLQQRPLPREDSSKHDGGLNKKKDSRDPYSFSAFLTAKNVTIPGDDSGSRGVMMQFLNEYLNSVTPSYPKRHVRNAQRQLKMLQRRAQQDEQGGSPTDSAEAFMDDIVDDPTSEGMYPGGQYGGVPAFTPVALAV